MTSNTKQQPLFTPVRMGNLELRNRIVMAPLTRMRANNPDMRLLNSTRSTTRSALLPASLSGNALRSAPMPTAGPIHPVFGAENKFGNGEW